MEVYFMDNLDEFLKDLDKTPKELVKLSKKALTRAKQRGVRDMKNSIPKRWKKLIKGSVKKARDASQWASVGLFNKTPRTTDADRPDWFKAYWLNYGTLKGRDPNHKFQSGIKGDKKRRNQEGVQHRNFFEAIYKQIAQRMVETYEREIIENAEELLK